MDASDYRRMNLLALIDECGGRRFGGVNALAEKIGSNPSHISALISPATSRRNVGPNLARRIEKAFGKPRGWMDHPHTNDDEVLRPEDLEVARAARDLPADGRALVLQMIRQLKRNQP